MLPRKFTNNFQNYLYDALFLKVQFSIELPDFWVGWYIPPEPFPQRRLHSKRMDVQVR